MLVITKERKARGISQSEMARRASMHISSLSAIETGRMIPWPGQITKLEKVMREAGWDGKSDLFTEVGDDDTD
ncbi:MAG: helix-turn-helix transcriptional regulator [Coriobacteriales bacterium]|jgi:transcriptional regulator with XRE-family HTH domain|nr:helix-turn-helix transcriptional regulator [Coriobacteriales bacterium]